MSLRKEWGGLPAPLGAEPDAFSDEEIALLSDSGIFRARARVIARLRGVFERLRDRLALHLDDGAYLSPEGTDLLRGRIGRGEYLDDMPYLYLDIPRYFDKQRAFTYRTLFWWGNGISFSLVLAGEHLPEYRQRLLRNLGILEALDVHVATGVSAWDWKRGPGHSMALATGEEGTLQRLFRSQEFLKCSRFLEFGDAEFRENRIEEAGLLTFRALEPLVLA